jgi:hypothetical protein
VTDDKEELEKLLTNVPQDEIEPNENKKALVTVYLSMMACQLMFLSIASFMPNYAKDHHPNITGFVMGFILS